MCTHPGRKSRREAVAATHHLNLAHGLAVQAIRAEGRESSIGISNIVTDLVPASQAPSDIAALKRVDANNNRMFLEPVFCGRYPQDVYELYRSEGLDKLVIGGDEATIATPLDFLGVNHYHQVVVTADPDEPDLQARLAHVEPATTSLRWSVEPRSLRNVLLRIAREYTRLPLYVTENGASFEDYVDPSGQVVDTQRIEYLHGYIAAAAEAIRKGVNLKGYFVWSLLDNFEWAEGYRPRFGLIYVDYATQARVPKASAAWYRGVITGHARAVG